MHSIQTKFTILTVLAIVVAVLVVTFLGIALLKNLSTDNAEQMLILMSETGQKNLDAYFTSVEQVAHGVAIAVQANLKNTDIENTGELGRHVENSKALFTDSMKKTDGLFSYYYRIDPDISETVPGFFYTNPDGEGFRQQNVTNIRDVYENGDRSTIVWFTDPKETGKANWLPSYITAGTSVRVVSYNEPIYKAINGEKKFIGVVGIEIAYDTLKKHVDEIKPYDVGYAFVNNSEGEVIYHPSQDVLDQMDHRTLLVPEGLLEKKEKVATYEFNGEKKMAAWRSLRNGLRLNVSIPVSVIDRQWQVFLPRIIIAAVVIIAVFVLLTLLFTRHFTKPLRELTEAAEQIDKGNYSVKLTYTGKDEIGLLSNTVNRLVEHLGGYIGDLSSLAYGDALTHVRNKGAFDIFIKELQEQIDKAPSAEPPVFAIGMLDCDDLKGINDRYGHDKGDVYLKNSCHLICRVFKGSPVFRIGGDEFIVVLQGEDYQNREALVKYFTEKSAEICAFAKEPWEQIRVAVGVATYDPKLDRTAENVIHRADHLMYQNKHERKTAQKKQSESK